MEIDYKQFIGCYAKRFYTPFIKIRMARIIDVKGKGLDTMLVVSNSLEKPEIGELKTWEWDLDDSVIITDGGDESIDPQRIADVNSINYKGFNPFK